MDTILTLDSAVALLTVTALLVVFFVALNYYRNRFLVRTQGDLRVTEQLPIGPKQRLIMIETRGKKLLLAVSQEQVALLDSWDDPGNA
ncbi:MAG: hypothetical protein PsegKO_25520 [Pseudohongiellaceae bacterium]